MKIIILSFDLITKRFFDVSTTVKNRQVMILLNPAVKRDSFFPTTLIFFLFHLSAFSQGIIGITKDAFSHEPIPGAQVTIFRQDVLVFDGLSDSTGTYTFLTPLAGIVTVHISGPDIKDYILSNVLLDGYSTFRFDHALEKKGYALPDVTVKASGLPYSSFARTIAPEDMLRVAGNFEDPVRIAHSQPGIVLLNDQANHLSARGQSPIFNTWYLEGLEIVNPNHTSNAGTLSDLPTQYGGGVNMFSAQILGNTDIYTGITPDPAGPVVQPSTCTCMKPRNRNGEPKQGSLGLNWGVDQP